MDIQVAIFTGNFFGSADEWLGGSGWRQTCWMLRVGNKQKLFGESREKKFCYLVETRGSEIDVKDVMMMVKTLNREC